MDRPQYYMDRTPYYLLMDRNAARRLIRSTYGEDFDDCCIDGRYSVDHYYPIRSRVNQYYAVEPEPKPEPEKPLSIRDSLHNPGLARRSVENMVAINRPRISAYMTEYFPLLKEALATLTYKTLISFAKIPDFHRIYYDTMMSLGLENYCVPPDTPNLHKPKLDRDEIIADVMASFPNIVACMEAKQAKIPPTLMQQAAPSERELIAIFMKWVKESPMQIQEAYRYALICVGLRDLLPGYPDPTPESRERRQALANEQKSVEKVVEYTPSPSPTPNSTPSPTPNLDSPSPSPTPNSTPSPTPDLAQNKQPVKQAEGYALNDPVQPLASSALVAVSNSQFPEPDSKLDGSCSICMARRADTVLGCTHVYCNTCVKDAQLCPHCRTNIVTRTIILWP